jgi:hypothetical protein
MKLLTKEILAKFKKQEKGSEKNFPLVKFFGGGACTWLLSEYDEETRTFFGLCDLGMGEPEMGYVSLDELLEIRFTPFRLGVERDRFFTGDKPLLEYWKEERVHGRIVV